MFHGFGPATELMQIYRLTRKIRCEDCGFSFIEDPLYFYLDLEHGQIIDALFVRRSLELDSPIKGWVHKTYCSSCNKHIHNYTIEKQNGDYDMEAAYYLLRLLLPRKLDFTRKRLEIYETIAEKMKANNLEGLEKDLKINRRYYEDLIPELNYDDFNGIVNENEDFNINRYVEVYKAELDRLKNTVFTINTGDDEYNLTLNGEKMPKGTCPNCNNAVNKIKLNRIPESCPKCGGKYILFNPGACYD